MVDLRKGQRGVYCPHELFFQDYRSLWSTHTHTVLSAIFPGKPRLASCPLNSPFPFMLELRILLGQAEIFYVILITIPPGLFRGSSLSNSCNLPRYTTIDPVIIIFSFNMSKPPRPAFLDHRTDWFQS